MKQLSTLLLLLGSLGIEQAAHADTKCDAESGVTISGVNDAPWTIQLQFDPKQVPLNTPFDATVIVCSQSETSPSRVVVDAVMPAHKHGMNYEPKTAQIDNDHYQVKNLLFHMPGTWRVEVIAYEEDKPYRFTHDIKLK